MILDVSSRVVVWILSAVNQLSLRNHSLDLSRNSCLFVVVSSALLSDLKGVSLTVLGHKVIRGAKHNESTVDHDSDIVTKLLRFLHSVSRQQDRGHVHLFDHPIERSARDWIDSSRWLI